MAINTTGVDFDRRCKKYRARLTRKGTVYHLGYFKYKTQACKARQEAEDKYNRGEPFDYLHSYSTSSTVVKVDGDVELYTLGLSSEIFVSSPERSLLVAILIQAIRDRLSTNDSDLRIAANNWFESTEVGSTGFSFLDICEELVLKPASVLETIIRSESDAKSAKRLIGRRLVRSSQLTTDPG